MQFTISVAALMAFASGALAQLAGFDTMYKPESGQVIPAGQSYTIEWEAGPSEYDDETISIVLLAGQSPETLEPGSEPIVCKCRPNGRRMRRAPSCLIVRIC